MTGHSPRLRLTCHLHHDLGDLQLIGDALDVDSVNRPPGYYDAEYRRLRETWLPELNNPRLRDRARKELDALARIGAGKTSQLMPTPDGDRLAWACLACFRQGINYATKRLRGPEHTGSASWSRLANLLAAAELHALNVVTLATTDRDAAAQLHRIVGDESPDDAAARKRRARALQRPEPPTADSFRNWGLTTFQVPL